MEKPIWVDNVQKYNRAKNEAKDPTNESEVKAIYVSYGGKLVNEEVVLPETKEEIKMEEKEEVIVTPEVAEVKEEVEVVETPTEVEEVVEEVIVPSEE